MSPLRSSPLLYPIETPIISDIDHSSRMPLSKHYGSDSYLSTDESEEPKSKKQKLQTKIVHSITPQSTLHIPPNPDSPHSANKKYKQEATISAQTKKTQTPLTKKTALSQAQINTLQSLTISLREFIDIYNGTPTKYRDKKFHTICRNYLHGISKTKTTFEEKKAMFLSLPHTLTTSTPLFKLIFLKEAIILQDIRNGKTDPKQLQASIDTLLQFFTVSYLNRQLCYYVSKKRPLSQEDKMMISSCRKKLKRIEKKHTTSADQLKPITHKDRSHFSDEAQKPQTHSLHPEARKILDSLNDNTIDVDDIVESKKKLILLKVDSLLIRNTFRTFRNRVSRSCMTNKEEILQKLKEARAQALKVKIQYKPASRKLKHLYDQAIAGTLPLNLINDLKILLFEEYNTYKASSSLQSAKRALIRHNKDKETEIQEAFTNIKQSQFYTLYQYLQTKIKEKDLTPIQFTEIYNSIPKQDRLSTITSIFIPYIKDQAEKATSFEEKLHLLRNMPQSLQKSPLVLKILFPDESAVMSSIKHGNISTCNIRSHLSKLLTIINTEHLQRIIDQYVRSKEHLTQTEKNDIVQCKNVIREQKQISQPNIDTHEQVLIKSRTRHQPKRTTIKNKQSTTVETFKQAIKNESLSIQEFTNSYNAIPTSMRKGNIQKLSALYIHRLSQQQLSYHEKLTFIKELPINLQTSTATIKALFPKIHKMMLLIRDGTLASNKLIRSCTALLNILTTAHIRRLILKYVQNKPSLSNTEKEHVAECRELLLNIRKNTRAQFHSDIEKTQDEQDYEEASTSTSQYTKPLIQATFKEIKTLVKNQSKTTTQATSKQASQTTGTAAISTILDTYTSPVHVSPNHTSSWCTSAQSVPYERPSGLLHKYSVSPIQQPSQDITEASTIKHPITQTFIDPQSPQPSTSYHVENSPEAVILPSLEQMSPDELICILQDIDYEDKDCKDSEDMFILPHNLLQLSSKVNKDSSTIEESPDTHTATIRPVTEVSTITQPTTQTLTLTYTQSQQPSTSYSVENSFETITPLPLEQMSTDELTCVLQDIDDGDSADIIMLQQYLLQLSREVQEESVTAKQSTSQTKEETSKTHTAQADTQDNNTGEPPQVPEDFASITEIATYLNAEELSTLADTIENTTSPKYLNPEDFFDLSNIDG